MHWKKNRFLPFLAREDGAVAVEFVILFPLFVLILMGILEFGHLWYVDHVITNASREGARAGVVYVKPASGTRQAWAQNAATVAVENYLGKNEEEVSYGKLPGVPVASVSVAPTAGNATGENVTVTVTVSDAALILDLLNIPGFNPLSVTAATTMRME